MSIYLHQSKVILWKSFQIRRRHLCWSVVIELLLPTSLFLLLVYVNSALSETVPGRTFPKQDVFMKFPQHAAVKILYSPKDTFVDELMENVARDLNIPNSGYIGLKNQQEVEIERKSAKQNDSSMNVLAVIFKNVSPGNESNQFSYKIMFEQVNMESIILKMMHIVTEKYITSGMITLQYALDKNYIELKGEKKLDTKFFIQKFPRLEGFTINRGKNLIWNILPTFTAFSFIGLQYLVPAIIEEKNSGIKELMKLMGLKPHVMWFGWFVNALVPYLISIMIIVILVKLNLNITTEPFLISSPLILYIHLLLYCIASISWMFTLSSLFQRPTLSGNFVSILWFASILLTVVIMQHRWNISNLTLSILFPNITLFFGYELIRSYEEFGIAFGFGYLTSRNKMAGQEMTMIEIWLMFLFEVALYTILTLYFEAVLPGRYGIPEPWYFPCKMLTFRKTNRVEDEISNSTDRTDRTYFEEVSAMLTPGIEIINLSKDFGITKLAVASITLDVYKDHITVLLGHNGAGKTVTMYMLTGMYVPTSGHIKINGYDVRNDFSKIRKSLGFCPQYNMLHEDLTVKEHLMFFAKVKGFKEKEALEETYKLLADLRMSSHQNNLPSTLSGGMKRRLCLGISLCGNPSGQIGSKIDIAEVSSPLVSSRIPGFIFYSQINCTSAITPAEYASRGEREGVLILDEPTTGLDPELRREVWNLLLNMRGQRTILISTHDMEEADVLGDYIAIMDHGRIKCYGTPMFLKDIFGTGYHLEIIKDGPKRDNSITQLVQRVLPEAVVRTQLPTLIVYSLPSAEKAKFPSLFTLLEDNKKITGITHIGVSLTSMEEVFLKIGQNEDEETITLQRKETFSMMESNFSVFEKTPLMCPKQFKIMLLKSILFTCRNYRSVIALALIPIMVTIFTILWSQNESQGENNETLDHKLDMFGVTKVLYKHDAENSSLAKYYEGIIKQTGSSVETVSTSILEALLSVGEQNYKYPHHIVAADFQASNNSITALYSGNSEISVSVSVNLITSALLQDSTSSEERDIEIRSQLFEGSRDDRYQKGAYWKGVVLYHIWWMGNFIFLPLVERVSEIKQLQLMTGMAPITYWLSMYVWDSLLNLAVTILIILTAAGVDYKHMYSGCDELLVVFCIFTAYGLSAIPLSYLFSYVKDSYATCFAIMIICFFLVLLLKWIFPLLAMFSRESTVNMVKCIISIIPYYAVIEAVDVFTSSVATNNECRKMTKRFREMICAKYSKHKCCACTDDMCTEARSSYIKLSGEDNKLFILLLIMVFSAFLYFGLLLIIDLGFIQRMIARRMLVKKERSPDDATIDSDVLQEEIKVEKALKKKDPDKERERMLLVWRLKKNYNLDRTAVECVSFTVQPGECFGLLGVNGAGKTTIFKMLTGSVAITQGDAAIYKWHLIEERSKFLAQIGYCPQTDSLISCFTSREHITLFARLRGLTKVAAQMESEKWIHELDIQEYQDKQTSSLSGGNKRKVCTAVALVGNPFLLMLDEPTSGVDPVSRRNLWNILKNIQSKGSCLVLTSHSMDECEAMCDRLAVMVNGRFQCLGNIQHLKQKFTQGYTVKVKLNTEQHSEEKVKNLKGIFNNLDSENTYVLKDEHETLLHYHVNDSKIPWSKIFTIMEDIKANNTVIQDYSISQTTLQEVFLAFARNQYSDDSLI